MSATAGVRSFVDLRAFADTADVPAGDYLTARTALPLPSGAVSVEVLRARAGGGSATLPVDEFVIVLRGRLTLGTVVLGAGRSAVVTAGTVVDWHAAPDTIAIAMSCAGDAPAAGAIVPIDEEAALAPSGAPLAALLVGETPSCRNHTDYRSPSGEFLCGTWDSTPYHRLPMRYRHYELMHLLAGSVTFEDEARRRAAFTTGDVFLVEQGAECSWLSSDHVRKVYAIHRPAG